MLDIQQIKNSNKNRGKDISQTAFAFMISFNQQAYHLFNKAKLQINYKQKWLNYIIGGTQNLKNQVNITFSSIDGKAPAEPTWISPFIGISLIIPLNDSHQTQSHKIVNLQYFLINQIILIWKLLLELLQENFNTELSKRVIYLYIFPLNFLGLIQYHSVITMIQVNQEREEAVIRSLQRLRQTMQTKSLDELIPALAFTVNLINEYVNQEQNHIKNSYYEMVAVTLVQNFKQRIQIHQLQHYNSLSKNKKIIVSQILQFQQKFNKSKIQYNNLIKQEEQQQKAAFIKKINQIQFYYSQHNLDLAYNSINKIKNIKQTLIKFELKQQQQKIHQIQSQYQKMIKFYNNFAGQNWIFDKEQDGIKLEYRVYEQQKTIAVRIFAQINMQMLPFLAIASQIDYQRFYVPFVYVSQQLKSIGRNRKAGYSKTYVPLLTDRQCYFTAVGYDRMATTGSLFLYTQSYDQNQFFQMKNQLIVPQQEQSEFVRLKVEYFCINYKPLSKTRAQIQLVTKADFKLPYLPLFILQKSARIFTFDYFQNIVKKAKQYKGSIWQEKVKKNPALYNFFQQKIDQYLK